MKNLIKKNNIKYFFLIGLLFLLGLNFVSAAPIDDFQITIINDTTATFNWSAITNATNITIEQSLDAHNDTGTWTLATTEPAQLLNETTTANVTGLSPSTIYSFRINVTGGTNEGYSNNITLTTAGSSSASAVDLGEAAFFALLSKAAISSIPTSVITGNVGLSPAAGTFITGLTCAEVTGDIIVASTGGSNLDPCQTVNPTYMTTVINNMETAFTAANAVAPDFTELGAGDISGMTLAPGVYKWNTGLGITGSLTLFGNSTDVWIFQIAGDLDVAASTEIILSGGATEGNVFWAVSGLTNIGGGVGTESIFMGTVIGGPATTEITVISGSVINGRLLSEKTIALDSNTVSLVFPEFTAGSVLSKSITSSSAIISWISGESANSSVNYGINESLLGTIVNNSNLTTAHSISLTNLSASTQYFYNITSCNADDECLTLGTYNFTTLAESIIDDDVEDEEDESSSSSSGSGGYPMYRPTETELDIGYQKEMRENWRISFKIYETYHTFEIDKIMETSVDTSIYSEIQKTTFQIGETQKFDLNNDDYYDLLIKLDSINTSNTRYSTATFTMQKIHEIIEKDTSIEQSTPIEQPTEIEVETTKETPRTGITGQIIGNLETGYTWMILLILAIVIGLIIYYSTKKKKIKRK